MATNDPDLGICRDLHTFHGNQDKCIYIQTHLLECKSSGFINYLQLFYCNSNQSTQAYILIFIWLLLLFYLLGDTASTYFCSSLKGLSRSLNLSPTVAGVTLLSLGNGAPDVFASIVSFIGDDAAADEVGVNSILGGAFFVSTAVVGIICVCNHGNRVSINRAGFIRDVLSLLFCLSCLAVIIVVGRLNLLGAVVFLFIYVLYVFLVSASELCGGGDGGGGGRKKLVLPLTHLEEPLLRPVNSPSDEKSGAAASGGENKNWVKLITRFIMLPLDLPRRLTIPSLAEETWSKPFAVVSAGLSPVFLAMIWIIPNGQKPNPLLYSGLTAAGVITGSVAYFTTNWSKPPEKRGLIPWLVCGFLMSIVWTYLLAEELVSLLVSLGLIVGISPSILGLTVLAWGNSLGDMVANLTMARNDGPAGAQIAITGCFCGPIFNVLVGLGLSFCVACGRMYPSAYEIPSGLDSDVYETMGFMAGGLVWSVVVLPMTDMKLGRVCGGGLLAIYLGFLSLKIVRLVGFI